MNQCFGSIINLIDLSLGDFRGMAKRGRGHWGHKGRPGKRGGSAPSRAGGRIIKQGGVWQSAQVGAVYTVPGSAEVPSDLIDKVIKETTTTTVPTVYDADKNIWHIIPKDMEKTWHAVVGKEILGERASEELDTQLVHGVWDVSDHILSLNNVANEIRLVYHDEPFKARRLANRAERSYSKAMRNVFTRQGEKPYKGIYVEGTNYVEAVGEFPD